MRKREKHGRADYGSEDRVSGPILKNALDEATINQFLAQCDRGYQGEKGQAFAVVLRKKFQGELREDTLNFFRLRDEAAQAQNLIEQNQRSEHHRRTDREPCIGYRQAELARANSMLVGAPQDHARGDPLKRESGSIEGDAIHFCGAGHLHQLADAAASEHRHGDAEKKQNESKIPMHDGK